MPRRLLTLLFLSLAAYLCLAQRYPLRSRRVSTVDGLAGNTINEIVQDSQRLIWMATNNGLSRYDGYGTLNYTSLSSDQQRMNARIGRIYHDNRRELLWLCTSNYQNACYDLASTKFVDWTGKGRQYRTQHKVKLTSRGMVLYGKPTGATLAGISKDGRNKRKYWSRDYTKSNGSLPSDDVLTVIEDSAANIWLPTNNGIAVLPANSTDNKCEMVTESIRLNIIAAATTGKTTCFLASNGQLITIDSSRKKKLSVRKSMHLPTSISASFVWQGRWLLFTQEGTFAIDIQSGAVEKPDKWQVRGGLNQGQCKGYHFIGNHDGQLWIFPDDREAVCLDLLPNARYSTNKGWKFHVTQTPDGLLYIATYGAGLYVYDPTDTHLEHYSARDAHPVIDSDYLLCAITDQQGNVWIGSEAAGAFCLSQGSMASYLLPNAGARGDWSNTITAIGTGSAKYKIGTRDGSLYKVEGHKTELCGKKIHITAILTDSHGHEWIGTWGNGLYYDDKHYSTNDSLHHIPTDVICHITEDSKGNIWIATWGAGILRSTVNNPLSFSQYTQEDLNGSRVNSLAFADDGTLWAASNNGLYRWNGKDFDVYNTQNKQFPNDEVISLLCDGRSTVWAGTSSAGVIRCKITPEGKIAETDIFSTREGLSNNTVAAILKDNDGHIWVGTENGLSRINTTTRVVNSYRFAESTQGNSVCNNSATSGTDGQMLFGTAQGLLVVNPHTKASHSPQVSHLTDLHINGQSLVMNNTLGICLADAQQIELPYDQNTLRFYFSCCDYDTEVQPVYQYYLEGHDSTVNQTAINNHAEYSELEPGHYTFHIRSLDRSGNWSGETILHVQIRQPWWNTWWAWAVYLLMAAGATYYVFSNWRERFRMRQQMQIEKQLMDMRMRLFTSITHEFRTPLAIIQGASEKLNADSSNKAALQTITRGTTRLLRLVNHFMEFRKIRTGNIRLQVEQADIIVFVRDIVQNFWTMASQKDITITFTPTVRHFDMPFDKQHLESMVYNLLSNAIKYTPQRGAVTVKAKADRQCFVLKVIDNGPGISEEQQQQLFKPFLHGHISQGGMGIGLYNTYELAKAHKGSIVYERATPEGGSIFTLWLPSDEDCYTPDEYKQPTALASSTISQAKKDIATEMLREMKPLAFNDITIAIIEDDPDMMDQISSGISEYFHVRCFTDGKSAISYLTGKENDGQQQHEDRLPALVISDVMLPDISGYDIVSRLRSNAPTANLPVIMLTALDDEEHQIRAYKAGADDYMVKPCNFRLLIARAIQLIKWRQESQKISIAACSDTDKEPQQPEVATVFASRADKVFLDKLAMLTAQHMADATFSVDVLAQMMTMGRTKFYGKVKDLTGMSPNKYLQEARMQKAADLLADGELNVAEVSYKVGIQDPSYFNKVFKTRFGVVPSKYQREA